MRLKLTVFFLMLLPVLSFAQLELSNDREGATYYSSNSDKRAVNRALREANERDIEDAFENATRGMEAGKACSFDIVNSMNSSLKTSNPKFSELSGAIIYLRTRDQFDDVVTNLLLTASNTISTDILLPKRQEDLRLPSNKEAVSKAIETIGGFEKKLKNHCFDEAYRQLYGEVLRADKSFKDLHLEALLVEAYQRKAISYDVYLSLEKARASELHSGILTLKMYLKKIRSIRNQFPLRDPNEKSDFVTGKVDKAKLSRRQRLLESYSDLQIMIMANVIKKLRTRLEAEKAEILIYDRNQGIETITLDPMERFRLAIKLLRKEMALLALNTYFNGRTPDYMDLMTAAYETGMIPASELEEVAGLQEIWNPKKTFWDKASVWIRTLSSVATIAIPPPYGFIPALALVVIEMTAGKKKDGTADDPTVLF